MVAWPTSFAVETADSEVGGGHISFVSGYLWGTGEKAIVLGLACCSVPARPCRRLSVKRVFAQSKHWLHISPQSVEHPPAPMNLADHRQQCRPQLIDGAEHCCGCPQQQPHAWWATGSRTLVANSRTYLLFGLLATKTSKDIADRPWAPHIRPAVARRAVMFATFLNYLFYNPTLRWEPQVE